MIFASDLDRTLIYSKRAIEDLDNLQEFSSLVPVEMKDGMPVSYMTSQSFDSLKLLHESVLFVPITTRTSEQFKRITLFSEQMPVRYAVTSNGANILLDGQVDQEWKEQITRQLNCETMVQEEFIQHLLNEGLEFKGHLKYAENLFFYYILDERITLKEKSRIGEKIAHLGWRTSLQGKKLYFIPKCINKGAALKYIQEKSGIKTMAGAGDSILDFDFLQYCSQRFVPKHGELAAEGNLEGFTITKAKGLKAGEEIANHLASQVLLNT
ncbi:MULTISPECIES: hypothetical protein [unclassified Bacillus (in: firmicutes)]|uniref:HAD family hydrolase n=1 Tax=unclassified Bacillus (in: firmicutes) TaxID=185979 RepID=UPI0008E11092|nr:MULTISPECIES: hypothetical protein [unclassified Bacillus (in: firmicutes)]SFB25879.1 Hydroxymethylpyrimidine pyrophosphatase [Bacillus sp. UNCCL13]SFQ91859.1 Hydroxymethylpyrimidine pyrophosphatase [Bacillus sp. cl95]